MNKQKNSSGNTHDICLGLCEQLHLGVFQKSPRIEQDKKFRKGKGRKYYLTAKGYSS